MASKSQKADDLPTNTGFSAPMDFENMAEVNYTALNAVGALSQRWYEAVNEVNGEMIEFINKRLKEDITIPAELAKCKTGEDLFEFTSQFVRKATSQYFDEAGKLAHIGSDFVGRATKVVDEEVREVHEIAAE